MKPARLHAPPRILFAGLLSVVVWWLYAAALYLPAVQVDEGGHACTSLRLGTQRGIAALLIGWLGEGFIPWLANPLLLVGWVLLLCGRYRAALGFGVAAAAAGATTLGFWGAGTYKGLLDGYFYWQASLVVFALSAGVLYWIYGTRACGGVQKTSSD